MKKFLHVLKCIGFALVPLGIVIGLFFALGLDLGVKTQAGASGDDSMSGLIFIVMGGGGWAVCTGLYYGFIDKDTSDITIYVEHPRWLRFFWSLAAVFAIGGTLGIIMNGGDFNNFFYNDVGFKTYIGAALPAAVAAFIFGGFLHRKFCFESFFAKYLLPVVCFGGTLVLTLILYLVSKLFSKYGLSLYMLPLLLGFLTMPVMFFMGIKDFLDIKSDSPSYSGGSGGWGGGSSAPSTRTLESQLCRIFVSAGATKANVTSCNVYEVGGKYEVSFRINVYSSAGRRNDVSGGDVNLMASLCKREIESSLKSYSNVRSVNAKCTYYSIG